MRRALVSERRRTRIRRRSFAARSRSVSERRVPRHCQSDGRAQQRGSVVVVFIFVLILIDRTNAERDRRLYSQIHSRLARFVSSRRRISAIRSCSHSSRACMFAISITITRAAIQILFLCSVHHSLSFAPPPPHSCPSAPRPCTAASSARASPPCARPRIPNPSICRCSTHTHRARTPSGRDR